MSKKQWLVLLMFFLVYLLLGALIFYHIESDLEIELAKQKKLERLEINALLHQHYVPNRTHDHHEILERLTKYCGKSVYNYTEGETDPLKWDFYNSFYFAYTVVSTIGYGNLSPTNILSRILMIIYGLIGIPINGILLTQLGEFFSIVFIRIHQEYKSLKQGQNECPKKLLTALETGKAGLVAQIFMYLTLGFVVFIFFPAFLFSFYEGWTYDEAVYYAFVTLTTIGFGDYVAGQDNTKGSGFFFILYKFFLICWISFGLGYLVMIMTFIARGMRSEKIIQLEHRLAVNLKHTQSKIWNEFNKEVNYLRRIFNELQLSKVKRVYVDECVYETPPTKCSRSNSFPDLRTLIYGGLEMSYPPHPRRRANSEVVPMDQLARVVSETDLQRIDKTATFATHAMVQPAELLARLVNILGYMPPPDDDQDQQDTETQSLGIHGLSDKEILANENTWNGSTWKIGNEKIPFSKPRSRAVSEVRLTKEDSNLHQQNGEWTWSGPAASQKIQELIKARRSSSIKDTKSKFPSFTLPKSMPKTLLPRWFRQLSSNKKSNDDSKFPDIKKRRETYASAQASPVTTQISCDESKDSRPYFTHTGGNSFNFLEGNNLLEETSLADFLRALHALHARAGSVSEEYSRKPQRKMGTASLTPPKLPSLFTLFSPPPGSDGVTEQCDTKRRFSLRNVDNSGSSTPNYMRRGSLAPAARPRRFSLRPVPMSNKPLSPHLSNLRQMNATQGVPLYPPFAFESSKEPLVTMEGAIGVSSPVTSSNNRRFSLRPAQIGIPPAPSSPKSAIKSNLPRWKAGMLQRQISQMKLQRRARAFSLSDVNTDQLQEKSPSISPLAMDDNKRNITTSFKEFSNTYVTRPAGSSGQQKTVTIVSPDRQRKISTEIQSKSDLDLTNSFNSMKNPFLFPKSKFFNEHDSRETRVDIPDDGDILNPNMDIDFNTSNQSIQDITDMVKELTKKTEKHDVENPYDSSIDETKTHVPRNDRADANKILDEFSTQEDCVPNKNDEESTASSQNLCSSTDNSKTSRKSSTSSQQSQTSVTSKNNLDKPRVSIDSYKSLLEVKIEKPTVNPFEQYRATVSSAQGSNTIKIQIDDTADDLPKTN